VGWGFFGAGMAQGVGHGVNLVRQFDSLRRDANEYQRKQQERDILDGGELPPASIGMRPEKQPEPQDLGVTANPDRSPAPTWRPGTPTPTFRSGSHGPRQLQRRPVAPIRRCSMLGTVRQTSTIRMALVDRCHRRR
jgi:hypothetical protein